MRGDWKKIVEVTGRWGLPRWGTDSMSGTWERRDGFLVPRNPGGGGFRRAALGGMSKGARCDSIGLSQCVEP